MRSVLRPVGYPIENALAPATMDRGGSLKVSPHAAANMSSPPKLFGRPGVHNSPEDLQAPPDAGSDVWHPDTFESARWTVLCGHSIVSMRYTAHAPDRSPQLPAA